jgi:small-conductance mechanosensitive channel
VADWLSENTDLTDIQASVAVSVAVIVALIVVRVVIARGLARRIDDNAVGYRARKATSYVLAGMGVLALLWIWVGALRELGTFLGLVSAGIAIALGDLLRNVAGWAYIILRRPYRVDDRIQIGEVAGDVIDIRVFRTTLLEIGNWVDADQSTGRIVHVPNGRVLADTVFNATEAFGYLWHEIPVLITYESDWQRAEQLLLQVLDEVAGHTAEEAKQRIKRASRSYKIQYTHLTPTVYLTVRESGVRITGRILVDTRRRRAVEQQVWRLLLEAFSAEPHVTLAYRTTRTYLQGPISVATDGPSTLTESPTESPLSTDSAS